MTTFKGLAKPTPTEDDRDFLGFRGLRGTCVGRQQLSLPVGDIAVQQAHHQARCGGRPVRAAADAGTRNTAFYQRLRAQILAARSTELGGIASFVTIAGQPINVTRSGRIVAAFTFDDITWTEVQQRTFSAASVEIHRRNPGMAPVLATTGAVTPMAALAISKLGWKIVQLKPQR